MGENLNLELVKKGKTEPREGLRDEGILHVGLGRKYEAELAAFGWPKEKTDAMQGYVDNLGGSVAMQAEAKVAARSATAAESAARADAKAFIGKVRLGAEIAILSGAVTGVELESFSAGKKLGNSTPAVCMYLEKIKPVVAAMDEQLKLYFGGEKPSEILQRIQTTLDQAQAKQESDLAGLPKETLALYETKGRLLSAIEEMNRVARIAFYERSELAGQFNKDLVRRGRRKVGAKTFSNAGTGPAKPS